MLLHSLVNRGLIHPPHWLADNTAYLTLMGSTAYGVSTDASDRDIYGFCVPPKHLVFPHLDGEILGFGRTKKRFEQFNTEQSVDDIDKKVTYDINVYSIVKYFHLCMENNPNMIDSLFTPPDCVLHATSLFNLVREQRKIFLHKGAWHKFKGYSYSQLHKMSNKNPEGKRKALVEKFGYDVKFGMHLVRLLNEVEQILTEGDIDIRRNNEQLKSIRRGEWTEQQIRDYFVSKEKELETLYTTSSLQHSPDESKIKTLLVNCLEQHYGNLGDAFVNENQFCDALRSIDEIIQKVRKQL